MGKILNRSSNKKIIRKVFVNKKNNQLSVSLSKKQIKIADPSIKFSDDLFVELRVFKKKKKVKDGGKRFYEV